MAGFITGASASVANFIIRIKINLKIRTKLTFASVAFVYY